jgi:hypothetical protein
MGVRTLGSGRRRHREGQRLVGKNKGKEMV